MSKRLSVSNLPHHMTREQLEKLLSEAGAVASVRIISYLHNGETSGYGFVEMKSQEESRRAVAMFDGWVIDGRPMAVREDSAQSKCCYGRGRKPAGNRPGE